MKLNERLETAFSLLLHAKPNNKKTGSSVSDEPKYARLFDVGCDHAYLSIEAVDRGLAARSFAMDVRQGPIDIARENIAKRGLSAAIETRCTFGLDGVELSDGDAVTILGMGGLEIRDIVARVDQWPDDLVLVMQPMKSFAQLRATLAERRLEIHEERLCVYRDKLYLFIVAKPSSQAVHLDDLDLQIGRFWLEHWRGDPLWPRLRDQLTEVATLKLKDPAEDAESLNRLIAQLALMK